MAYNPRHRRPMDENATSRLPENLNTQEQRRLPASFMGPGRYLTLILGFLLIFAVMLGRVFYLQVIEGPTLRDRAARSQHRNQTSQVYRGRIVDRNGVVLAQDTLVYDFYVHPKYYKDQPIEQIAALLSTHLQEDQAEILRKLRLNHSTVLMAKNVSTDVVKAIKNERLIIPQINEKTNQPEIDKKGQAVYSKPRIGGLDFFQKPLRRYPQGRMASHVLGYVNDAAKLSTGVHSKLDSLSRDWFQQRRSAPLLVDGRGNPLEYNQETLKNFVQVAEAQDVQLTIDSRLQFIAERELKAGLASSNADRAALIMIQPKTGEVLAMAAYPDFDPEDYFKATYEELKNWAITDVYEPGSTIKILTVANGLESGKINTKSLVLDTGKLQVGGWWLKNYDYAQRPYPGMIDLVYLLQHSSNIGSAKIAMMQDKKDYYDRLINLGFGSRTGISMTGESQGRVPPIDEWSSSRHASMGYGYGFMTTPMQMIMAINSIANGGMWIPPKLIKGVKASTIEDSQHYAKDLREKIKQPNPHRVYSKETADAMSYLLVEALNKNKKHPAYLDVINVAGKTGTARKIAANGRGYSSGVITSFAGYFPAENPQVLMMVVVDNPKMAESWGSTVAAPIFRRVALETVHYLGLAPKAKIEMPPLIIEKKDVPLAVEPPKTEVPPAPKKEKTVPNTSGTMSIPSEETRANRVRESE